MPVSDDLHPRSFLTKISKYQKVINHNLNNRKTLNNPKQVVNVPNSISLLQDLLPIAVDMAKKKRCGVYNFTNPGAISHNGVLALYKKVNAFLLSYKKH